MAITLYHVGRIPVFKQFGLDEFTERYKTDSPADVASLDASVPQKGDAHGTYSFMFVTDRHFNESPAGGADIEIVYMGSMKTSDGAPVMPPAQNENDNAVMSASSSRASGGAVLSSPITVQYYAPTTQKTFFTYSARASSGFAPDPSDSIVVITLTIGDTNYLPGGLVTDIVAAYFNTQIVQTCRSPEVVSGQYWQNISKKTKTLVSFPFFASAGEYVVMYAPGTGYTVGDDVHFTDGTFTAHVTVTQLGLSGSILTFTTASNTFNYTTTTPIYATGGTGSGAAFYNYHIV